MDTHKRKAFGCFWYQGIKQCVKGVEKIENFCDYCERILGDLVERKLKIQ